MHTRTLACNLAIALTLLPYTAFAQGSKTAALEDEAVETLQRYLRVDTTNPPGNESRAVDFFAEILESEGIPYESAESAPGRGNIWARLEGGAQPALLLLNHSDVVAADEAYWSIGPLSGEIRDGHLYGRGALDMKSTAIFQFQTFLALHRANKPLNRDVIFMATADEEAGGFFGAGWILKEHPESVQGVGMVLNEGGDGSIQDGKRQFSIEVTQKVPFWIRLVATGEPGHGSTPHPESAVTRLVQALSRIHEHQFTPRITTAVDTYFKALAPHVESPWREAFEDMKTAVQDPAFMIQLQQYNRLYNAIVRNTVSITRLEGSPKINVVPPSATAEIDCRILPDQDPEAFLNKLRFIINDPNIALETIMVFTPAISSIEAPLYKAIESVISKNFPNIPIIPSVSSGFTDSHFFRDRGIDAYGFSPVLIPSEDDGGVHGNDERISIENIKMGTRLTLEIVESLVY